MKTFLFIFFLYFIRINVRANSSSEAKMCGNLNSEITCRALELNWKMSTRKNIQIIICFKITLQRHLSRLQTHRLSVTIRT